MYEYLTLFYGLLRKQHFNNSGKFATIEAND